MDSLQDLEKALQKSEGLEKIDILLQLGKVYARNNLNLVKAEKYCEDAITLAIEHEATEQIAACKHQIGIIYWGRGDFINSRKNFSEAYQLFQQLGDQLKTANLLMCMGVTYLNTGELQQSISNLRSAVFQAIKLHDKKLVGIIYNWLGIAYNELTDYKKAFKYYLKSLRINEKLKDQYNIAIAKNSIGLVYQKLNNFVQAEKFLNESLQIRQDIDDQIGVADCLNNLGMIFRGQENYEKSLDFYLKSLIIREKLGGGSKLSITLNNIANLYATMGKFEDALSFNQRALEIREKINDKAGKLISLINISGLHNDMNNLEEALKTLELANAIEKEISSPKYSEKIHEYYAKIYEKQGDYKKALEHFMLVSEIRQKIFSDENAAKLNEMQVKYELEKEQKEAQIYRLKNVELSAANKTISNQNEQLQLISRILRHDIANNLYGIERSLESFFKSKEENCLQEVPAKITKSTDLIQRFSKISYLINEVNYTFPLDVRKIIEQLLPSYENLKIELNGEGEAMADDLLESVLDNIISNAIKHGKTDRIKIDIENDDEWLSVSIADYGKGIPEVFREKIFEESFVYGDSGNTGLGLFIVKKAVENYGGTVTVMGNNPQGTVFIIKLKKA